MNKKITQYAAEKGLTAEPKENIVYGRRNGYFVSLEQSSGQAAAPVTLHMWVKPGNKEPIPGISEFLNMVRTKYKYLGQLFYEDGTITASLSGRIGNAYITEIDELLDELVRYCQTNELLPCCEACGSEYELSLYQIEGSGHAFCTPCYTKLSSDIQKDMSGKRKLGAGNVPAGIVGALLGSLLGVLVWVLIYQLGYISAIGGIAMFVFVSKGYELFGGRLNLLGIIITCLISIVMVYVSVQTSFAIEIHKAYKDLYDVSFFDAFKSVPDFLEEAEVASAFAHDLIIGYILMAVGAAGYIYQAYKNGTGKLSTRFVSQITGKKETL